MNKKMKNRKIYISTFLIGSFVLVMLLLPIRTALIFYEKNTDVIASVLPITKGEKFDLIFTHSIHLTDVVERYEVLDTLDIQQYEMIFEEFGIGMPSVVETHETYHYEDGKHHIKGMQNNFTEIKLRNGKTVSKNRLAWYDQGNRKEIYLNDYFEPGDWFTVKVEKLSLLSYIREVKIDESKGFKERK